jgi:4-hydroxy-tetrahydrodipicolinate synthase
MIPKFVRGSIAPVFTAFHEDGRLDDEGQRSILSWLAGTKAISAFFVRSGMGQMFSFSYDDVRQIAKTACGLRAGNVPVLMGCSGIWDRDHDKYPDPQVYMQQAVDLSKYAEDLGAGGVVHTLPEAIQPKSGQKIDDVIMKYFETICAAVKLPVFIYQSPGTDERYILSIELVRRLADIPNLAGMKASTNDAHYIFNITYAVRDKDFGFISGAETAFLAGLISGSRAVIGQGASVNPRILNAIQTRYEKGDIKGACEAQWSTNLLVLRSKNTTEFFKRYISEKGYKVKPCARVTGSPYSTTSARLSQEEYDTYKDLLESELEKYASG